MPLLNDIHHLTFITADLDCLIGFYERIFEARLRSTWKKKAYDTPSSR